MTNEHSISIKRKSKMPGQTAHSQPSPHCSHILEPFKPGNLVNRDITRQPWHLLSSPNQSSSPSFPNKDPFSQLRGPHTPSIADLNDGPMLLFSLGNQSFSQKPSSSSSFVGTSLCHTPPLYAHPPQHLGS